MSCSPPIATIHTALLEEGQAIERVGFIKEGNCLAHAKVPNTPRPVQVRIQDTVMFVLPNAFSGVVKKIIFFICYYNTGMHWWAWSRQLYWRATLEGKGNSAICYCLCNPTDGWMGQWYSNQRQVLGSHWNGWEQRQFTCTLLSYSQWSGQAHPLRQASSHPHPNTG